MIQQEISDHKKTVAIIKTIIIYPVLLFMYVQYTHLKSPIFSVHCEH